MKIENRGTLLNALVDASELEHGLLCQYLFAAFSVKETAAEGISWEQAETLRRWKRTLLEIAREEMAHLGTVCNLLTAVGGAPHFRRPNFPQTPKYYPLDIPYDLERLNDESLTRFVRYETPATGVPETALIAPSPISFSSVGDLYRAIRDAFETLPESELFIGPQADQDDNDWSRGLQIFPVADAKSAIKAIDFIISQGEGVPAHREGSHYSRFVAVRDELRRLLAASPRTDPARPVALNPATRLHRDTIRKSVTIITDPVTLAVAELLNVSYETTLLMLQQFYSFGAETSDQREVLRQSTREMMSGVVRPLGELLTRLPVAPGSTDCAGACFELYGDVAVTSHTDVAWKVIEERLRSAGTEGINLEASRSFPRLQLASENLITIANNLSRAAVAVPVTPTARLAKSRPQAAKKPPPIRAASQRYARPSGKER